MHVPNPLGGIPLILRDTNTKNPRDGELLLDYNNADLYYVNKRTGLKSKLADSIYKKIIASKLENSTIEIVHSDSPEVEVEDPIIPDVTDRAMNTWYMNIIKREEIEEASE